MYFATQEVSRIQTLMPTCSYDKPSDWKHATTAARSSASAPTPCTPQMSMFHW